MILVVWKSAAAVLWVLASAKAGVLAASERPGSPDYVNVVLNFASLAILVGGLYMAPKAFRARAAQAQLSEKDQVIAGHKQLREVREEELGQCKERLRDMGFELDAAQKFEAHWRGRYEEQQQYTAQPALEALQQLLTQQESESERRHRELIEVLARLPVSD